MRVVKTKRNDITVVHATEYTNLAKRRIISGWIGQADAQEICQPTYQRGHVEGKGKYNGLIAAFDQGENVNSIVLGLRSKDVETTGKGVFILRGVVAVIDGLQRLLRFLQAKTPKTLLHVTVWVDTNEESEKRDFYILNIHRLGVSPNIIIRNAAGQQKAVGVLLRETKTNKKHVLYNRVCWEQDEAPSDRISVLTLGKTVVALHGHLRLGIVHHHDKVITVMQAIWESINERIYRTNISTFYEFVNEKWGFRDVGSAKKPPHLSTDFLWVLAVLFSIHRDFWTGPALVIPKRIGDKLGKIQIFKSIRHTGGYRTRDGRQELLDEIKDTLTAMGIRLHHWPHYDNKKRRFKKDKQPASAQA